MIDELVLRKLALANAIKFDGKANPSAIIGQAIKEMPQVKNDLVELNKAIEKVVDAVNILPVEEQIAELETIGALKKEVKKREGLKELPGVKGKVVMRIAPSPSGQLHIGHAFSTLINYLYVKKYGGKFYLRIEDTNPENIEPTAYDEIPKEANWLTENGVTDVIVQSDRLKIYYKYIEKLFEKNALYVCDCDSEQFKEKLAKSEACTCRDLSKKEQLRRWNKMFDKKNGYQQGEVVIRVKTDLKHKNPAMRDFPIVRINDAEHPRTGTKHRVWPLMNLAVFVDDLEYKMTHVIRGKDHMDNARRQEILYNYLELTSPISLFNGRINFFDMQVSSTKTKEAIKNKQYSGWHDIRLPTIAALKRRGFEPKALQRWVEEVGLTQVDKKVSKKEFFKSLNHYNKEIIDPIAQRYFFVANPTKIFIQGAKSKTVKMLKHPDKPQSDVRKLETTDKFYISHNDLDKITHKKVVRLIDCLNFIKDKELFYYHSDSYVEYKKNKGDIIIHWLPVSKDLVNVEVLTEDGTIVEGLGEPELKKLEQGSVVQFERFGFVRLDKITSKKLVFWFSHK
ncbi:glutamate--tRNA ligase [Candidatus Woesearchaeota archaeon]|nr:glutamate--tRNA ligase [Candidatus Woesearchaeota archaeon]